MQFRFNRTCQILCLLAIATTLAACNDPVSAAKNTCPEGAQQYWKKFRGAVLKNDIDTIVAMTQFPFVIVKSIIDESDKVQVERAGFVKQFPQLLNIDPGTSPTPSTMKQLTTSTKELSSSQCNALGSQFNVSLWFFQLTPDGWRFVRAYTEEN